MAQIAIIAAMAGGQLYKGAQAKKLKEREAQGFRDAAMRRKGVAHREMAEERRKKEFMYSRALALAAFSGAGVDDPGMVTLLGDLNAEGEYRILSRLYAGENEAEGLLFRAEAARREGKAARSASYINAITSAVSAYSAFGGGFGSYSQSAQMSKGITASKAAKAKQSSSLSSSYAPQGAYA